jgi:hypothetical protein
VQRSVCHILSRSLITTPNSGVAPENGSTGNHRIEELYNYKYTLPIGLQLQLIFFVRKCIVRIEGSELKINYVEYLEKYAQLKIEFVANDNMVHTPG